MKKVFIALLVLCLFPVLVYAKTNTQEELLLEIAKIENVQVDENVKILKTSVTDKTIDLELLENDLPEIRNISYHFDGNDFVFSSGEIKNNTILNNQYAFYLYSILENKSTAPYEEENYYNESRIHKILSSPDVKKLYVNKGKTFGLSFENNKVNYHYYLDGEDTILFETIDTGIDNPNTGNLRFYVTILLLIVVGLGLYTYWNPEKKRG